jgi:hypothetical protein
MSSVSKKVLPECTNNRFDRFVARRVTGTICLPFQSPAREHASDEVDLGPLNLLSMYTPSALMMGSPSFRNDRKWEREERSPSRLWCCSGWIDTGGHPNKMQCMFVKPFATVTSREVSSDRTCAYKMLAVAAPAEWPVNKSVDLSSYSARDFASGLMSDLETSKNPAWHRFCCP